jgi:bifunctional DNA-binding transcriptional regulator/antitoxin component of YhaV-PrlF toxin-antitoxin module
MRKETVSLKTDGRGRITLPGRLREKAGVKDEEESWWVLTIEGLDPDQHPEKSDLESDN